MMILKNKLILISNLNKTIMEFITDQEIDALNEELRQEELEKVYQLNEEWN